MCNLYSVTKGQAAIIELTRALRDKTGNLPPMPGVFPDYSAPIVRNAPDGVRELMLARSAETAQPRSPPATCRHQKLTRNASVLPRTCTRPQRWKSISNFMRA